MSETAAGIEIAKICSAVSTQSTSRYFLAVLEVPNLVKQAYSYVSSARAIASTHENTVLHLTATPLSNIMSITPYTTRSDELGACSTME